MKIICRKADLLKGVQIVSKAVPSKTTMPILECILIDATLDCITLTTNDMELGIKTSVIGTIDEHGYIAINAKMFSDIIRKLPDNEVTISTTSNYQMTITCEETKFTIPGLSGEDFVNLPDIDKQNILQLSQFTLKEMIRQTIFSISDNDSKKILTGELFEIKNDIFRVVSLDGNRLSIRKIELKQSYDNQKIIVPGKTLIEIAKILTDDVDKTVQLYGDANHIVVSFDDTIVVSRLIEGEYIKIDHLLSNDYETIVHVNRKKLLSCIDRATLLISESDKKPIIITIEDDNMELKISSQIASMNEKMAIDKEGKDLMIAFNPRFLIDALRAVNDEEVCLYFMNAKSPCFLKDSEESYVYMILPVNFNAN